MDTDSELNSIVVVGCGWLGTPLAAALIERGYRVVATRSSAKGVAELQSRGIGAVRLALRPALDCDELNSLNGTAIAVILLPPQIRKGSKDQYPEKIASLLSGLKDVGIRRLIFSSSTSVYRRQNREVDETGPVVPDSDSGRILFQAERRIMDAPGVSATVVRFAGLCGPGREPGRLLAGRTNLPGGNNPVNLIHQQDAIQLLASLIERPRWGRIFNGCAPCHPLRRDLYPDAARSMGLAPPAFGAGNSRFKIVRGDTICKEVGFEYRYPDPSVWCW